MRYLDLNTTNRDLFAGLIIFGIISVGLVSYYTRNQCEHSQNKETEIILSDTCKKSDITKHINPDSFSNQSNNYMFHFNYQNKEYANYLYESAENYPKDNLSQNPKRTNGNGLERRVHKQNNHSKPIKKIKAKKKQKNIALEQNQNNSYDSNYSSNQNPNLNYENYKKYIPEKYWNDPSIIKIKLNFWTHKGKIVRKIGNKRKRERFNF